MDNFILYHGPSEYDGSPIVVIATGLSRASVNTKTGAIVPTWILREDVHPVEAIKTGLDSSICGSCQHRGVNGTQRTCYVRVANAPTQVWRSYHRGLYPVLSPAEARAALAGRMVRLGAYGDPAAVPMAVWDNALRDASAFTGYTHGWKFSPKLKRYCMASCDTEDEFKLATAMGWRTFRVRRSTDQLMSHEVICPASSEAGHRTTCEACKACGGTSAKAKAHIAIIVHGNGAVHFN